MVQSDFASSLESWTSISLAVILLWSLFVYSPCKGEKRRKKKKSLRCSVKAAMELIVCFVVDYLSFTFKAFNLHLKYVEAVLQRLAKANLSLKLNKFKFGIFLVSRDFTEILSYRNSGTFHHCKYSSKSCQCTQYYICGLWWRIHSWRRCKIDTFCSLTHEYKGKVLALIVCASRVFSQHEIKYSMSELDFLAIVWALEYFWPYLER